MKRTNVVLAALALFFLTVFSVSCFLLDLAAASDHDLQQSDNQQAVKEKKYTHTEPYVQEITMLVQQLQQVLQEGQAVVAQFEKKELGIRELDAYIKKYKHTVNEINQQYAAMVPPQDAQNIHHSFGVAMDDFMASVDHLRLYLDTSLLNLDKKIGHAEDAFQKIMEAEQKLQHTAQLLEQY